MLVAFMILLGILALAMFGLAIYEGVMTAKGTPSAVPNWLRLMIGPIAVAILAIIGIKALYERRKQAACKRQS